VKSINRRFFFVLSFFAVMGLLFVGCEKTENTSGEQAAEDLTGETEEPFSSGGSTLESYTVERIQVLHNIDAVNEQLPGLPFSTGAHREHLNDPLAFKNLPDGGVPDGPTAVIGSDVCFFYPVTSISSVNDVKKLPKGEALPLGTIIPLGAKVQASDSEKDGMFDFQENLNFFYKTSWGGKNGIVFGSDLYGMGSSNTDNRVNALLYKGNGHFDNFYPVTGYDEINAGTLKNLETNGLAFQEVKSSEYYLSLEMPDDMISLYMKKKGSVTPVFVTTDLAAHANHLVFDRMFQYVEEEFFFPQLLALTDQYITLVEQKKGTIPEEVYTTSLLYFQTAKALLALAPKKIKGNSSEIEYQDVDAAQVLRNYPPAVVEEIGKMNNAAGFGTSSIFNFKTPPTVTFREDYSQYKVRGHYTKNGVLGAYFRALMWYGRINFSLGGEGGSVANFAQHLAPMALFITDITENSPALKKIWQSLFDPITELIGASDDISFYELAPLWNKIKGAGFAQWYNDTKKRNAFFSNDYKELRPPVISGSSVFLGPAAGGPDPEKLTPPLGWRLFGQRYTLDGFCPMVQ